MLTCYICGEEIKRRKDAIKLWDDQFHEMVFVCSDQCQKRFEWIEVEENQEMQLAELRSE